MPPTDPADDPLGDLRAAAERLVGQVPPNGWASPPPQHGDDVHELAQLLGALQALVPAELRDQLNEVLRQVLLLLRGMIDVTVARLEAGAQPPAVDDPAQAQDIPID